jgi:hypothetical protein
METQLNALEIVSPGLDYLVTLKGTCPYNIQTKDKGG